MLYITEGEPEGGRTCFEVKLGEGDAGIAQAVGVPYLISSEAVERHYTGIAHKHVVDGSASQAGVISNVKAWRQGGCGHLDVGARPGCPKVVAQRLACQIEHLCHEFGCVDVSRFSSCGKVC